MITLREFYRVLANVVPLYAALMLGFSSVKWLKMFSVEQCSGISKFVSKFAVPLLSFAFISTNNLYSMKYRFLAADTLQKIVVLIILILWCKCSKRGSIEWLITLFSVSALPSIIVMGVPMLEVMYGRISDTLLVQTVVLQYLIWFPMLLFLLEYRAASNQISVSVENQLETKTSGDVELPVKTGTSTSSSDVSGVFSSTNNNGHNGSRFVRSLSAPSSYSTRVIHHKDHDDCEKDGSSSGKTANAGAQGDAKSPSSVKTMLILSTVWRKLIRNPNTYASVIGLTWSLISFRWHVEMPTIVSGSIKILSDGALGMAMFSLGLFMGLQPRIISCGKAAAAFAAVVRFIIGPIIMAAMSFAVGLRGTFLHIAIVQAALPLGIVTFVFAKEYDVHPEVQSTGVIFGMLIALPITLVYYIFMGL